jgi:F-box and WD-40 domain protein 1/11
VLCLKFEGDWERGWGEESEDESESENERGSGNGSGSCGSGSEGGSESEGVKVERKRGRGKKRETNTKTVKETARKGFMVSGSSDCSVCVWDLMTGQIVASSDSGGGSTMQSDSEGTSGSGDQPEREVNAEVRAVLKGHVGGVLDLRIDKRWIVSWCVGFFFFVFPGRSRFDVDCFLFRFQQFERCSDTRVGPSHA